MKKIRFLHNNLWDSGTLTYSSQSVNFPASNVRHRWHTKYWESTGDSGEWLLLDAGSAISALAFAIKNHNFTVNATVKIQGNSVNDWASPPFEQALNINSDIMTEFFTETQSHQYWRLYIDDSSNPDGVVRVGRIFLGGYFEPERNFSIGYSYVHEDPSLVMLSEGGQLSSIIRPKFRRFVYQFVALRDSDVDTFKSIYEGKGLTGNFFVCEDADDRLNKTYYVRFSTPLEIVNRIANYYDVRIELEELR